MPSDTPDDGMHPKGFTLMTMWALRCCTLWMSLPTSMCRINERSLEQIIGIEMVNAKRHEQAVSDHREVVLAPRVGGPVNEARRKICCRHSACEGQREPPLPQIESHCDTKTKRIKGQKRDDK